MQILIHNVLRVRYKIRIINIYIELLFQLKFNVLILYFPTNIFLHSLNHPIID